MVGIVGAPVEGFYEVTGHAGMATVPVTLRPDGRFFAPRVPLRDGAINLLIVPIGRGGSAYETITLAVTGSDTTTIPASIQTTPLQPQPGATTQLSANLGGKSAAFEWDFDGDGTFDAQGAAVSHAWSKAGAYLVVARTRVNGLWVSASTTVTVSADPEILASATVADATGVFVLPVYVFDRPAPDGGRYPSEMIDAGVAREEVRFVAVTFADRVELYDPTLTSKLATLSNLSNPSSVATDLDGRVYVADTGNNRIVRFTGTGALDQAFGNGGSFTGPPQAPFVAPLSIGPGAEQILTNTGEYDCNSVLRCSVVDLSDAGVSRKVRYFLYHANYDGERLDYYLTAGGHLLHASMSLEDTGITALDVAPVWPDFKGWFFLVDSAGTVQFYQGETRLASWTLPHPVRGISATPAGDGTAYVLGNGHVELRDFHLESVR